MPTETIHFRVEFEGGAIYHIIASSNVEKMEDWSNYFNDQFTQTNGVASLVMKSDEAKALEENEKNVFDPEGNAHSAAKKLINILKNKYNGQTPIFCVEY